jgi:hypothetical protein
MNNLGYIDFPKKIQGLSGQWFYAINTDPEELMKFLSKLSFEVYSIEGNLITNDESLFHIVEKAFTFDPFHRPIISWGMWDEYWGEFVNITKLPRIAIVLKDIDSLYEINTQLFLKLIYDLLKVIFGLERRKHDNEIHYQAVLFILGKGKGYMLIESKDFVG